MFKPLDVVQCGLILCCCSLSLWLDL